MFVVDANQTQSPWQPHTLFKNTIISLFYAKLMDLYNIFIVSLQFLWAAPSWKPPSRPAAGGRPAPAGSSSCPPGRRFPERSEADQRLCRNTASVRRRASARRASARRASAGERPPASLHRRFPHLQLLRQAPAVRLDAAVLLLHVSLDLLVLRPLLLPPGHHAVSRRSAPP